MENDFHVEETSQTELPTFKKSFTYEDKEDVIEIDSSSEELDNQANTGFIESCRPSNVLSTYDSNDSTEYVIFKYFLFMF